MTTSFTRRTLLAAAAASIAVPSTAVLAADAYPAKPIRLVVPVPPGGGSDAIARVIAQQMAQSMNATILVDNKAGAGGTLGSDLVAKSPPDGYTLLMINNAFVINPSIYNKLPFDPVKDFAPITIMASSPNLLVAHPSLPANNVKELIALAKQKPGQIAVAVSTVQMSHLAAALLEQEAGIDLQLVPYKGAGQGNTDLLAGTVSLSFGTTPTYLPFIKTGKLKALGIGGSHTLETLPSAVPINQTIPGFEANTWFGLFAPAGTPKPIIDKLRAEVVAALKAPSVMERVKNDGYVAGVGITPEQFAVQIKQDMDKWSTVVKRKGIKLD